MGEGFEGVVDGGEGDNTLLLSNNFNGNYKNFDNLGVTTDGDVVGYYK